MIKILMAIAIGGALFAGCSKQKEATRVTPGPTSKLVSFSIYADPSENGWDPDKTSASIRLSVLVSSLSNIFTEVIWDTTISMRNLRQFPGPKEPMVFSKMVTLNNADREFLTLTCNKIYIVNERVETRDQTIGVLPSSQSKTMDIAL